MRRNLNVLFCSVYIDLGLLLYLLFHSHLSNTTDFVPRIALILFNATIADAVLRYFFVMWRRNAAVTKDN